MGGMSGQMGGDSSMGGGGMSGMMGGGGMSGIVLDQANNHYGWDAAKMRDATCGGKWHGKNTK